MSKTYISTFTYKEPDFDVLYAKGMLSYVFEMKGERYGNAVRVDGKSILDIMNASMNLVLNLVESYDAALKHSEAKQHDK